VETKPCEFSESLTAYLDGELSSDSRERFEAHLGRCTTCPDELAVLRRVLAGVALAERIEPSSALRRKVLNALDAKAGFLGVWANFLRARFLVPVGAFATVAALAAVVLGVRSTQASRRHSMELDVANHLDLLEDYELISNVDVPPGTTVEDVELVGHLDELMK
jgi:anti-sigma factor RsiW